MACSELFYCCPLLQGIEDFEAGKAPSTYHDLYYAYNLTEAAYLW